MKTIVKTIFIRLLVVAACLILPKGAESKVFYSIKQLLATHFKQSARVTYVQIDLTKAQKRTVEKRLKRRLGHDRYTFNVALSDGKVDGYALLDRELGQHEPIDFATFFDARGRVTRVEVLAYREPYGAGIRSARFRRQFVGRTAKSSYRAGKDIDIVSGATISSKSMARAVHRAAVVLDETVLKPRRSAVARR